jgi:natural product precursor
MKRKLNSKLVLKRETLNSLNTSEMNSLKGGGSRGCAVITSPCGLDTSYLTQKTNCKCK